MALALCLLLLLVSAPIASPTPASAAPEGTLTFALHFSPVNRWLDPAEGESTITPYLLLYALHDALLKPMPGAGAGVKFHNGDPVTAEDVKSSFERYRGGGAKILKDNVPVEPHAVDPRRARQLLAEAGYPNGFDAGEVTPFPPYNSMGEAIAGWLQAVGIRARMRTMERAAFMTAWRDKKLKGVVLTISGVSGNAATRLESLVTSGGAFAYGALPEIDVSQAPVYHLGFPTGVGPRVEDILASAIPNFYMAPYEDLKLRRP